MSANRSPQRMRALERANEIRHARRTLKEKIARGEIFAASVLLSPPPEAATWTVGEMLMVQRGWGRARMRKFLGRCQVPQNRALGEMTERQRRLLAGGLGGGGAG